MNLLFALTFLSLNLMTHSFSPKNLNVSAVHTGDSGWSTAGATYYGQPNGYGTYAGACGYKQDVAQPPFSAMVSAGGPSLFKSGKGCGARYQIKCTSQTSSSCSNNPITVVITDECAGCSSEPPHFDLSTTAFNAMAISGQETQLQTVGKLQINYRKVACNYGKTLTFHVKDGSNPYYFAVLVEYVNGGGEIGGVKLKQAQQPDTWLSMNQLFGAYWKLNNVQSPLQPPLSLRVTLLDSDKTVEATDVIPVGWQADTKYESNVNFQV